MNNSAANRHQLYVTIGPSQARKRLKGHGFGVKRIESAGTHRTLIIHTATGDHLRALEALFQDCLEGPRPEATLRSEDDRSRDP